MSNDDSAYWHNKVGLRLAPALPTALASMGLLMLLSACVANYEDRCMEQGYKSGSPEFADCVEANQAGPGRAQRRHCPLCKSGQGR